MQHSAFEIYSHSTLDVLNLYVAGFSLGCMISRQRAESLFFVSLRSKPLPTIVLAKCFQRRQQLRSPRGRARYALWFAVALGFWWTLFSRPAPNLRRVVVP